LLPLLALGAGAAAAQLPGAGAHVTPYVGYMVFGSYFDGPLGTTLTNAPGFLYGTQADYRLSPNVAVVANLGYTSSDLQVGLPYLGGISVGKSSMLVYDADLELDLPNTTTGSLRLSPFFQAGAGGIRYDITESIVKTRATNLAGNIGVGADVPMGRGLALRVMAKDYIGKFNFQDAIGFDVNGSTAHNWAFSAGMKFDF
jgi:hypothetical protein